MCQVPSCSLLNQARASKVSKNTFFEKKHMDVPGVTCQDSCPTNLYRWSLSLTSGKYLLSLTLEIDNWFNTCLCVWNTVNDISVTFPSAVAPAVSKQRLEPHLTFVGSSRNPVLNLSLHKLDAQLDPLQHLNNLIGW